MQYHGIASYKLEYQLSTGGEWTTAKEEADTNASFSHDIGSLTGNTSYNLKYTVVDKAGNTGTATGSATTKRPERNPGGVISNIVSDPIIYLGMNSPINKSRMGQEFRKASSLRSCSMSTTNDSWKTETVQVNPLLDNWWIILAEDDEYVMIATILKASKMMYEPFVEWATAVGTIDATIEYCCEKDLDAKQIRGLKLGDIERLSGTSLPTYTDTTKYYGSYTTNYGKLLPYQRKGKSYWDIQPDLSTLPTYGDGAETLICPPSLIPSFDMGPLLANVWYGHDLTPGSTWLTTRLHVGGNSGSGMTFLPKLYSWGNMQWDSIDVGRQGDAQLPIPIGGWVCGKIELQSA